ncbi:TetR/AcrR family transcriptional regulator [Variovorax sp. PCZ-1]|uniref:TetR/AcrR family transcriptional regulator n=1 Tax=Variovorax sp. PCZ-1 TaxID=2835533 RepID=UPI001BD0EC13|nr:TetR/AcrR family transcriptional regulator [Variovorax sp. PCZ-1]MBS7807039.1 TetR/AcrR family transcriptional regulator [Variovorax sp. PCZ-1]
MKRVASQTVQASQEPSVALLDAARHIFISEGVKGLSVRRVAEQAGCTTMLVYSRFNGKDGILGALFDEGFEKLSMAQRSIKPGLQNEDRLLALCQAYRATAKAYPHHYALMLGQHSGELKPSESSQLKAMDTLLYLTDTVASLTSMQGKKRQAAVEVANALFALCHGWVSLEKTGFFDGSKKSEQAFERAVLALAQAA